MYQSLQSSFFGRHRSLIVRQRKELIEIIVDWETKNQYAVLDEHGQEIGTLLERAGGFMDTLRRGFLRSHRGFEADLIALDGSRVLHLSRNFFFLFSDLDVYDSMGRVQGRVRRRFGIIYKRYDLEDPQGRVFARIKSPRWRLWTFPIVDDNGQERGAISKRWGGALREIFSDADTFRVDLSDFSESQKAVIFAAAISIDFDFFENNQGSDGVLVIILGD